MERSRLRPHPVDPGPAGSRWQAVAETGSGGTTLDHKGGIGEEVLTRNTVIRIETFWAYSRSSDFLIDLI